MKDDLEQHRTAIGKLQQRNAVGNLEDSNAVGK